MSQFITINFILAKLLTNETKGIGGMVKRSRNLPLISGVKFGEKMCTRHLRGSNSGPPTY